jgi:Ca-activated chloride channel family protein
MTFAWPLVLWLLLLPAGAAAGLLARRRSGRAPSGASHPQILRAEAGLHDLALTSRPFEPRRPGWLLIAGVAAAIVALARPQWGQQEEPMFDRSREILLAIDLSRSMLTPDVAPSRLERSKLLIQSLLDRLHGERVGLVAFSGTAFLQAPMSADYEILREFLPQLNPDFLPDAGTNYGPMLETAASAFSAGSEADRFLIVLSDGGANDEGWQSNISSLTKKGVHVIALGIGSAAGGFIPDGHGGFIKDDRGAVVLAKLDSQSLRQLADRTHGLYRDASDWIDVPELVKTVIDAGKQGVFQEVHTARHVERFQWALAPALLLLFLSYCRELPVRPKPRALRWAGAAALAFFAVGVHAADTAALPPQDLLSRIVGRLADSGPAPSALDWAELARQTLTWGQAFASGQQPVPPGPVNDALDAVQTGRRLDPKAADWDKLRADLEALRQPPPEKKLDQSKQDQKDQKDKKDQKDQKDSEQKKKNQSDSGSGEEKPPESTPGEKSAPKDQSGQDQNQPPPGQGQAGQPLSDSVLGHSDGKPGATPPPPAHLDQQPVGGQPPPSPPDPARLDPALAGSLQKLDRVHDQDSPGQLFQMLANQNPAKRPPPPQHPKNW